MEQCIGRTVDRDALVKLRREKYERLIGEEKIRDGVEDYLNAARKLGLKIGLASSSTRPWVVGHLEKLGILHYFECIHTAEDVEQVKPDPALYIKTLQCLGVKPEEAIAFEDSPNGALAAKRAGMYCVIVPNFVTETLPFHTIDIRLQSMAEIALEQLLDKIASSSET
ncbi:2-deoxyglucose-6-phosphate phosphatase [compost metagenome]